MYITRFNTVDDEVEEYLYHTEEEAKQHLELFKDDDSGLYTSIEVFDGNDNLLYHLEFDNMEKTYCLYVETVDEYGELLDSELVDVCTAKSIEECLKISDWQGSDANENEQYCVHEEYGDGYEEYYYPFGEAKIIQDLEKRPKYSDSIMRNVRETFGLEPDDTSLDKEINEMDKMDVFEKWLQWEGILGYEYKIKEAVDNIFYGK